MKPCLEHLVSHFSRLDQQTAHEGIYQHLTSVGQPFAPSNLCLAAEGLFQLDCLGLLNHGRYFCDVGSADGRMVAVSAGCLGIPSVGIEYDHRLVEISRQSLKELQAAGLINRARATIIEGDFCRSETYRRVPFGTIATFYCFESNCYCVAEKIVKESPTDTMFVFYTQSDHACFRGLERVKRIDLGKISRRPYFMYAFSKPRPCRSRVPVDKPCRQTPA